MAALATALSPRLELGSRARAAPRAAVPAPPLPRVVPVIKSEDGREHFILPTLTPEAEVHESGWTVKVDLEGAGSARPWRSGQSLRGKVTVQPQEGLKQQTVYSLVVRCYWQSTVIYTTFAYVHPSAGSDPSSAVPMYSDQAEYHRGYALPDGEGLDLPVGDSLSGSSPSTQSFPFAFTLPTSTHSSFANPAWCPPASRTDLMKHERCPPPTYSPANLRDGSVDWIVEVMLRTSSTSGTFDELPSFDPSPAASGELSSRGLLRSTPDVLVKRITFPFAPHDRHVEDYQGAWHDPSKATVPSLGRDPRDELLGTKRVAEEPVDEARTALMEDGRWMTYFKDVRVGNGMRKARTLRCEVSLPLPLRISQAAEALPFILHLSHIVPTTPSSLVPSSPCRPIFVTTVTLILYERLLKRGGCAVQPIMSLTEVHRAEIPLADNCDEGPLSRESTASSGFASSPAPSIAPSTSASSSLTSRLKRKLSPSASSAPFCSRSSHRASSAPPSLSLAPHATHILPLSFPLAPAVLGQTFRLPHLEREYVLSISLSGRGFGGPKGQGISVGRLPVQIIAGDEGADAQEELTEDVQQAREEEEPRERRTREKLPFYQEFVEDTAAAAAAQGRKL